MNTSIRKSDNLVGNDGFKPMFLPETGEELLEGRQYLLTPLARLILKKEFGLAGIPTVVECIKRKVAATIVRTMTENLETGTFKWTVEEHPGQEATFRAFLGHGKILRFTIDFKKLEEFAPYYSPGHKLPGNPEKDTDKEIERLEQEWFDVTSKYRPGKFRGCTHRWWAMGGEVKVGSSIRRHYSSKKQSAEPLDLSVLGF